MYLVRLLAKIFLEGFIPNMQIFPTSKLSYKNNSTHPNKVSFGGPRLPNQTFETFEALAKRTKFLSHAKDIIADTANYLDEGMYNVVFKIPDIEGFLIRIKKENMPSLKFYPSMQKSVDDFPSINIGQKVAELGEGISVVIKQNGTIHGIRTWYKVREGLKPVEESLVEYMSKLRKLASLDQSAFNEFAEEVRIIRKAGYNFDFYNPKNILVDDKINIVDIEKDGLQKHLKFLSKEFLLFSLVDKINILKFYKAANPAQKAEIKELVDIIKTKTFKAAQKQSIPQKHMLVKIYHLYMDLKTIFKNSYLKQYNEFCKCFNP